MSDEKFQELVRIIDATLGNVNPDGLITGQNALAIIQFLSQFPNMTKFISPALNDKINTELSLSHSKLNVREHVKNVLMFSTDEAKNGKYLPWDDISSGTQLNKFVKSLYLFEFDLIEGKVYAKCLSGRMLTLNLFVAFRDDCPHLKGFVSNTETCHITLVNSNVVADIGEQRVKEFLQHYKTAFSIQFGKIKSTVSRDWSRFSHCVVIEVSSSHITQFVDDFSNTFNKKINLSPHITFAIKPRDLWLS